MTSPRSESYGRVMETLRRSRLFDGERAQVRAAADTLFLCDDVEDSRPALDGAVALSRRLIERRRWTPERADRLVEDIAGCGPFVFV